LYWVTLKDFVQFKRYVKEGLTTGSKADNALILAKIIAVKIAYFFVVLGVPALFTSIPFSSIFLGFLVMHFLGGVILSVTFQLAHTVEGTSYPLPNEKGIIENEWTIHQLNTTVNFCPNNKLISWYVGGLNFQVEHHLFPRISHVHYPQIAPIVRETAEEFGIPYLENSTLVKALSSHIVALQQLGRLPDINEAIA
jgi:linoleoyl-CoA desaturase